MPESDYEVIDDWDMTGLRGTGSRSLRVDEAFIPEYRIHRVQDDLALQTPGSRINPGTIYRLPFWGIGARAFSAPAVGLARGMMDLVVEDIRDRTGARAAASGSRSNRRSRRVSPNPAPRSTPPGRCC